MTSSTASTPQSTYVVYWLYKLDPAFHHLSKSERREGKEEFLDALEQRPAEVTVRGCYSLVGLRSDADLMFWVIGPDLDAIQQVAVKLRHTGLGRYLRDVETYIGAVTAARYDPEHQAAFLSGAPAKQYVSVYPFVKTNEWYLLPFEQRRDLMAEHGRVGRRYAVPRAKLLELTGAAPATQPESASEQSASEQSASEQSASEQSASEGAANGKSARSRARATSATAVASAPEAPATASEEEGGGVLSNTVDAFGLGDYEFILANESDDPVELVKMMEALRKTEVRRYTRLDTPIYFGRLREPAEAIADL